MALSVPRKSVREELKRQIQPKGSFADKSWERKLWSHCSRSKWQWDRPHQKGKSLIFRQEISWIFLSSTLRASHHLQLLPEMPGFFSTYRLNPLVGHWWILLTRGWTSRPADRTTGCDSWKLTHMPGSSPTGLRKRVTQSTCCPVKCVNGGLLTLP